MLKKALALILLMLSPTIAHAYGAYALGRAPNGGTGAFIAWNGPTQAIADEQAILGCTKSGNTNCQVLHRFSRACWPAPRLDTKGYVRLRPLVASPWAGRSAA